MTATLTIIVFVLHAVPRCSVLEQEQAQGKPWFVGDLNAQNYIHLSGRDKHVGDSYHGYPTQVVAAVSGAMGHNRLKIIFSHYNYID